MHEDIIIKGARENNLQNVDLIIPRNQFIVFTGLSGSGKTSLAFDTLYAEGQRRYVESLSSYARQFLGQMDKPDVDHIEGLSPAISIDQKTTSRNPRSTVGTVTEIHDYLRLLYARIGTPHCPQCGRVIHQQSVDQMVDILTALPEGTRMQVMAPVVRARKGEFHKLLEDMRKSGFVRARVDGQLYDLGEEIPLVKNKRHTVEIIVDRLVLRDGLRSRIVDSLETALKLASGLVLVDVGEGEPLLFSQNYACPDCGISIEELAPRMFSFNSPFGACPTCTGLGVLMKMDPDLILPDKSLTLLDDKAIAAPGWASSDQQDSFAGNILTALAQHYGFRLDVPIAELPKSALEVLLYGSKGEKIKVDYQRDYGSGSYVMEFEGLIPSLERKYHQTSSQGMKELYESFMSDTPCPDCHGDRLKREALAVTVGGQNLAEVSKWPVGKARQFFRELQLTEQQRAIGQQILKEIDVRLGFLIDVGLDYLTLARAAATLSGGEAQRIRLATQIGSALVGVLYILDEPSIGLHQRDNARLLATLKHLRDQGNTLVVVEHDEDTMFAADHIVDIGPGAGSHGGRVIAQGTAEQIMACPDSITGQYLSGKRRVPLPKRRRKRDQGEIVIRHARANNLKDIDVAIPLGVITCVTGVSGSGKSSLVNEILYKTAVRDLNRARVKPGDCGGIEGLRQLDKVINIDQSPIGRTPRSNPATYTGLFDMIRDIFAATPEAKMRGYRNGRFSFNVKGGRCEACRGDGILKIEMHFLPDVYVPCEVCGGKRYNQETLQVHYKGKNISEVLEMTVEEALGFFDAIPRIRNKLQTLYDVGLGYIKLGQPSTTLSGGEAQRVKLATELSRRGTGRTLYVLDEPTTGLHVADVERLVGILHQLAKGNNTVVVIEHNLDVIKTADYVIDLGPEGGDAGGTIVATGTPEELCKNGVGYTAQFLAPILQRDKQAQAAKKKEA